uniref:Uncharacterized protein n=1 Tax=Anguilla anguilla TaxID=7936 RepID=A0A0E9XLT7_ANGAN
MLLLILINEQEIKTLQDLCLN